VKLGIHIERWYEKKKKIIEEGDLVLVHLRKVRFPRGTYSKLKMNKIYPYKIIIYFFYNALFFGIARRVGHLTHILVLLNYMNILKGWMMSAS
jgi:hypothetical protein